MEKMLKKDLLVELATDTNMSQTQVDAVLTSLAKLVAKKTLDDGIGVVLMGLGTFTPNFKKARDGHNPKTGAPLKIAAKTVIKFKPVASLVKAG